MLINNDNGTLAYNVWLYEKVCFRNFQFTTTANIKLYYTPC